MMRSIVQSAHLAEQCMHFHIKCPFVCALTTVTKRLSNVEMRPVQMTTVHIKLTNAFHYHHSRINMPRLSSVTGNKQQIRHGACHSVTIHCSQVAQRTAYSATLSIKFAFMKGYQMAPWLIMKVVHMYTKL